MVMALPAAIPSPPFSEFNVGPLTIHIYGITMALAMLIAMEVTERRYVARGGQPQLAYEVALWAIPFGIVGARLYHVFTSPDAYFGPNGSLVNIFKIWNGGLGIWGAVAAGALGAWICLRRHHLRVAPFADAIAPALLFAQAFGRLGNWFNQELFGGPTTLPWGLQIDAAHLPATAAPGTLFHPTFLYELLWNVLMALVLIRIDRTRRLAGGQLMWLYICVYTLGRGFIEALRIDEATLILGVRLNVWTSLIVFVVGVFGFYVAGQRSQPRNVIGEELAQEAVD